MIKHKVKYRVVGADRTKRKYSINLDDGTSFHLTRELLQGTPAQEGSRPLCSYVVQNGALWIKAGADQADIVHNGQSVRECEARPGDLVQVGEFSVEVLECPHAARSESNATQFLDVSEMFGGSAKSSDSSSPAHSSVVESNRAPEPAPSTVTESPLATASSMVTNNDDIPQAPEVPSNSWDTQDSPTTIRSYTPAQESKQETYTENKEFKDETRVVEHSSRGTPASTQHRNSSHAVHSQDTQSSFNPSGSHVAAARSRSSYEDTRGTDDPSRSTSMQRSRTSSSQRDAERGSSMHRSSKRTEETHKTRRQTEQAPAAFSETDFSHLGISAGMAALGVAATTRVLVSGSTSPQGMVVACAALSSIPVVFGLSLGLTKLNEFLGVDSHLRDYARFLGWAMICSVPWAYTQGASFPVAIFTTLLTTVLISVAFIGRFRPNMARFSGVGAGLSAAALAALITHHHFTADKNVAQDGNPSDTPAVADANTAAPAASASNAPAAQTVAATTAQTPPAASPNSLSPQTAPAAQAQAPNQGAGGLAQQNTAPAIPSNVNDTIPPIPTHPETSLGANATGRTPANADASSKGIIDPLAHEEFFSAIKMGNLEVVKSLIDRKQVDPDFTLDKGSTPLIVAAASGRMKVVEYLLRRRVNINAQDPHGTTALMWAVFKGHRDVAKFLISKGADTKVIRDDGDTAMDIARKWRQNEIVALLKEAAQDENGVSKKTRTPASRKRRRR